ncbi:hypothetical protein MTP99_006143 [Tenebrio molitor]|nr:hypothetical protein MTP99_006143 [Tenebrio molitor]
MNTPEGYAVIWMKLRDPAPEHYRCVNQINLLDLIMMLNNQEEGEGGGGEATPVRIKGLHYINVVPFADTLIGMAKPFMKKELVDMLNFHDESMETLYKYVPKEIMPKDYGGEGPSLATLHEENTKNLLENMDLFKWKNTLKVDESKRPGKPRTLETFSALMVLSRN